MRGFNQFALVFDELSNILGAEFSTAELMSAAQHLIALSKQEYVVEVAKAVGERPNYYSLEVDYAFSYKQSQISTFERLSTDFTDNYGLGIEVAARLRRIVLSADELSWEF